MKNNTTKAIALFFIVPMFFLQQGCVKDSCTKTYTYTYFQPLYKTSAEVRANIKSNAPKPIVNPGKIYIKDSFIFLNEVNKGIHVIDNSLPSSPKNIAFIDLPGNVDIAIKGNMLYADFYTDLVAIDISNPLNAAAKKFVNNVFPERFYYGYNTDPTMIIYDWVKKTETIDIGCNNISQVYFANSLGVSCTAPDAGLLISKSSNAAPVGISGSMARFALINDYLYTVGNSNLNVLNISSAVNPVVASKINLNWGIETIFPFKDKLFIGSNSGMLIYNVQNPANPVQEGSFNHVRTCDPVIADNDYAYVILHSGTTCQGFTNQLDVLSIANLHSPQLVQSYPLTNPRGLSKDGNLLFICDGDDGLKIFNAANPLSISIIKLFKIQATNDVIAYNNIALVIAQDGLYQYDYSNVADIKLISKIAVQN